MNPLNPRLRSLLDAERRRPDAPSDAKELARAQLATLLGAAGGLGGSADGGGARAGNDASEDGAGGGMGSGSSAGTIGGGASSLATAKLVGALLLGGLVGGGVATAVVKPVERIVYVNVPASVSTARALAEPSGPTTVVREIPVTALPDAVPGASPSRSHAVAPIVSAPSEPRARDVDLSAERAIIERARSALARGDGSGALVAVSQHEREFAKGQLVEEREVVAVQALVTAGRVQEAAERGARFRKAFPNSLLLPIVDQALR